MIVNVDEAAEFLRTHHRAVLSTLRSDGRPQLSPVLAAVDDAGRVLISTRETALKVHNLRRDPRVSLCVFSDAFFGDWVQIDGNAEVVALPEAMDLLIDYYRRISGEHPDWDDYRRSMEREKRVVVRFQVDRAGPNASG